MRWLATTLALAILVALPAATAQGLLGQTPEVTVEDAGIEGVIQPAGAPGQVELTVAVECHLYQGPGANTRLTIGSIRPDHTSVIVSPSSVSIPPEPTTCTEPDTRRSLQVTVTVAFNQDAPAFEPVTIPVAVYVHRAYPDQGLNRTHGPYLGNVTATPGYIPLFETDRTSPSPHAEVGTTARTEIVIANDANGETRFDLALEQVPSWVEADVHPNPLVLGPDETGTYEVTVTDTRLDGPKRAASLDVVVTAGTTSPQGGPDRAERDRIVVWFEPPPDESAVPGTGAVVAALVALAVGLARRRGP